jgi:hypothetical protein
MSKTTLYLFFLMKYITLPSLLTILKNFGVDTGIRENQGTPKFVNEKLF